MVFSLRSRLLSGSDWLKQAERWEEAEPRRRLAEGYLVVVQVVGQPSDEQLVR